jgi:hypothetical protein
MEQDSVPSEVWTDFYINAMNLKLRTGRVIAQAVMRLSLGGPIRPQLVHMRSVVWERINRTGMFRVFRFWSLDNSPRHAPYSLSSMCCFHQKDKRTKPGNIQNKCFLEIENIREKVPSLVSELRSDKVFLSLSLSLSLRLSLNQINFPT